MQNVIEQLRKGVDTNCPPDKTDALMYGAANEIERLRAWLQRIDDYYQTGGDLVSHMAHMAQDALAGIQLSRDEM